jgi:NinB protein
VEGSRVTKRRLFILAHETARGLARQAIDDPAHAGWWVRITPPGKSRGQEERYHAMIGDIAKQWEFCGRLWDAESMKRLLIDQFRRDTIRDPEFADLWAEVGTMEMAPSIDGSGVVALGFQSRRFPKKLASGFIEWLFAFGAENGVEWSEAPLAREAAAA